MTVLKKGGMAETWELHVSVQLFWLQKWHCWLRPFHKVTQLFTDAAQMLISIYRYTMRKLTMNTVITLQESYITYNCHWAIPMAVTPQNMDIPTCRGLHATSISTTKHHRKSKWDTVCHCGILKSWLSAVMHVPIATKPKNLLLNHTLVNRTVIQDIKTYKCWHALLPCLKSEATNASLAPLYNKECRYTDTVIQHVVVCITEVS